VQGALRVSRQSSLTPHRQSAMRATLATLADSSRGKAVSLNKWLAGLHSAAAYVLAAALVLLWLFMAPTYIVNRTDQFETNEGKRTQLNVGTLVAGAHITDWLLVIVGSLQVALMFWQAKIYRGQRNLMEGQVRISERQTGIMEGLPTLYPILRSIGLDDFRTTRADTLYPSDHMHFSDPKISFAMKNYGTAPAILLDVGGRLTIGTDPPPSISDEQGVAYIPMPEERMIAQRGVTHDFTVKLNAMHWTVDKPTYLALMKGESHVWLSARVIFSDLAGNCTAQHICWRCNVSRRAADPYPAERNYKEKTVWTPHDPPSSKGSDESLIGL
jgi:hypothetical protein